MKREFGDLVVGPAEPVVNRIRNQYLMELLLKLPRDGTKIQLAKLMIRQQSAILLNNKKFRSVVILADVDPV
jgi:primosomal protein N' (replication factor Y) (superfamily II helicase)